MDNHYLTHPGTTSGDCCIYTVEAKVAPSEQRKDLRSHSPVNPNGQYGQGTYLNVVSLAYFKCFLRIIFLKKNHTLVARKKISHGVGGNPISILWAAILAPGRTACQKKCGEVNSAQLNMSLAILCSFVSCILIRRAMCC